MPTAVSDSVYIPSPGLTLGYYSPDLFKYFGFGLWGDVSAMAVSGGGAAYSDLTALFNGRETALFVDAFTGPVYRFSTNGTLFGLGAYVDAAFRQNKLMMFNFGVGAVLQSEWHLGMFTLYARAIAAYTFGGEGEFILIPSISIGVALGDVKLPAPREPVSSSPRTPDPSALETTEMLDLSDQEDLSEIEIPEDLTEFNTPDALPSYISEEGYFATADRYRRMETIGDNTTSVTNNTQSIDGYTYDHGVFSMITAGAVSPFQIARYETTYELWYEVKVWAQLNGYRFTDAGREGSNGRDGAPPTQAGKTEPVTMVSWRDAVVWCNAYSQKAGRTPVYYRDAQFNNVIKSLSDDTVFVAPYASGYRLPTEEEWETAARGGDLSDDRNWNYTFAGSDTAADVAWYQSNSNNSTQPVGKRRPNKAGLYDMSGNVHEWCWDWYVRRDGTGAPVDPSKSFSLSLRTLRGGSWYDYASTIAVSQRYGHPPIFGSNLIGFRLVCPP